MSKWQLKIAALWLGAIIAGIEKSILQPVRIGLWAVEPHAAAWTATIHSFISIRPSNKCLRGEHENEIRRSDECRLLYLTESDDHRRFPVCPWRPFGTTPLSYIEVEVQKHALCRRHCLRYMSWCWELVDGISGDDIGFETNTAAYWAEAVEDMDLIDQVAIQQEKIQGSDDLSKLATQSIFGWLRVIGIPPNEKGLFTHEWLDLEDSDDESGETPSSIETRQADVQYNFDAWLDSQNDRV